MGYGVFDLNSIHVLYTNSMSVKCEVKMEICRKNDPTPTQFHILHCWQWGEMRDEHGNVQVVLVGIEGCSNIEAG